MTRFAVDLRVVERHTGPGPGPGPVEDNLAEVGIGRGDPMKQTISLILDNFCDNCVLCLNASRT